MLTNIAANHSAGQMQNVERRRKLLDQMRQVLRTLHYSYRTEQTYTMWIEKFLRFSRDAIGEWRHLRAMNHCDIERFLFRFEDEGPGPVEIDASLTGGAVSVVEQDGLFEDVLVVRFVRFGRVRMGQLQ